MIYQERKKKAFTDPKRGGIALSLAIVLGLFLLSVLYLTQINGIVARNFELRSVQALLKERQDRNQQFTISLMQARAMKNLESAAKELDLVAVGKVSYLKIVPEVFALSQNP